MSDLLSWQAIFSSENLSAAVALRLHWEEHVLTERDGGKEKRRNGGEGDQFKGHSFEAEERRSSISSASRNQWIERQEPCSKGWCMV
jgi:hypothetical protein